MDIGIFGDSIAWGAYDLKKGGWVGRYKKYFENKAKNGIVYNLGIPGNTISDLIKRFRVDIKDKKIDVIVLAIGINDVGGKVLDFENNVNRLYKMAKKNSPKIIFVGLTRVDEDKTKILSFFAGKKYTNKKIEKMDEIIKIFCEKNKIKYIYMGDVIEKEDLIDGLHPNTSGHKKMYKKIRGELKNLTSNEL